MPRPNATTKQEVKKPEQSLYAIVWVDSASVSGWVEIDDVESKLAGASVMPIVTVGFLIRETDDEMVLSGSISGKGQCESPIAIPKKAIQSKKVITYTL